jgi:hypothetical protein
MGVCFGVCVCDGGGEQEKKKDWVHDRLSRTNTKDWVQVRGGREKMTDRDAELMDWKREMMWKRKMVRERAMGCERRMAYARRDATDFLSQLDSIHKLPKGLSLHIRDSFTCSSIRVVLFFRFLLSFSLCLFCDRWM